MSTSEPRLRPAPAIRLAPPELHIDLQEIAARLRNEATPSRSGHRQETVLHRGAARLMLFAFDAGGHMPTHSTPGEVTIQVLRGVVRITTGTAAYDLVPNQLLTLDPGVKHDVMALTDADMLLGVTLERTT